MSEMLRVELGEYVVFRIPDAPLRVTAFGRPIDCGECGDLIVGIANSMVSLESKIAQIFQILDDF